MIFTKKIFIILEKYEQFNHRKRGIKTMYYTQEQIDRANQADLVSFLQSQGEQLTRAGNEYRWKRHDSLTVRGNKWYRHSQSKGGAPIDFVMEFFGKSFTEAVEMLTGEKGAAPPPDRPSPASLSDFRLPPPNSDIDWSKSIPEIDQQLYKKYGLTPDEIKFIETHVKEME